MAEAALDHAPVEDLQRVLRPETERLLGVAERLVALAVAIERPGQHVVAVDRGALRARFPRKCESVRQADPVVDVEEGCLEIGLDAVRDQQLLDHGDQRVLLPRLRACPLTR